MSKSKPTKEDVRKAMNQVGDDAPDGAYWQAVHDILNLALRRCVRLHRRRSSILWSSGIKMIGWKERQERIEARGAEYRAGAMTEAMFTAYLFSMHLRGQDISHKLNEYAPPVPPQTFEERRLEVSREWLERYHDR